MQNSMTVQKIHFFPKTQVEIADGSQDWGKMIFWEDCKDMLLLREFEKLIVCTTTPLM